MSTKTNLAARIGRWSVQHRRKAILGWLAFVIIAFGVGQGMGMQKADESQQGVGESGRAAEMAEKAFPPAEAKVEERVLVESATATADAPEFRAAVTDVITRLKAVEYVSEIESPYSHQENAAISKDDHSALVTYKVTGEYDDALLRVEKPLAAIDEAAKAHPAVEIGTTGDISTDKEVDEAEQADLAKAGMTSLPLTLLILVFAFGAILAAGVPVLLALSGVLATMGLMGPASILQPVAGDVSAIVLLIGLAVGVDYSIFYMRRAREARDAGHDNDTAIEIAAATSGRAVVISGLTVMVSMAGMYLAGIPMFESFATATIVVVAVSVIGSVTVLPALLSKLGDKIEKGRVPFHGRLKARTQKLAIWSRITDRVLRRPLLSVVVAGGLLVALATPTLSMHTALPGFESLSRDHQSVQTWDKVQEAFPTESIPVMVAIKADDVTAAPVAGAIDKLERAAAAKPELYTGAATKEVSDDKTVAMLAIPAAGDGSNEESKAAMKELREELAPEILGPVDGVEYATTGNTAGIDDFNSSLKSHMPYVFGFVLIAAFILLLVTFRSIVIPLKAIVLNMLSVGAAYGLLVLVFQNGWGESLLGFESTGAVTAWLPPFLFVILFGLSMDYHVFIISRIKEAFDGGMSTEDAVAHGIKSTAGVVTSAAIVMVGVFSIFGTMSSLDMKQMGVGLAAAVLIDATIIRGVLLPASMKLLGDRNWWLPKSLNWLPKLKSEGEVAPASA